ncbi:MAG TPA: hydroxysqualene dehydroxylase HpnE [Pusillimonas sp.]|uniref:hydroxysqualene dehydroxylase HpnE n=1 Tax=Pusillimonas sp. TaxID=3040095 RepID=UPI002CE2F027|nr:hydroxysqualene dehydroxylase HpnE [Pusillimonas sp.]HUH88046.1 hydroxysqualene dehydroxylase HpnE [Pusillimonas sp.]
MKVAVVGAGWAGLSAALELHRHGHEATVFESGHRLGGRARSVHSRKLSATVDNGQHILLAAYTETLRVMQQLGLSGQQRLLRMPLDLQSADRSFRLQVPKLPDALALPAALLLAQGLSWRERLRLATLLTSLKRRRWQTEPGLTVAQWLAQGRQSTHIIRAFWDPLCVAAMNTPVHHACAQLFANVLRDSLGAGSSASQVLISRVDLSSLWPERLPAQIRVLRGRTVRRVGSADGAAQGKGRVLVDDEVFDAAIIATNVWPAHRLLQQLPAVSVDRKAYLSQFESFSPMPIATLTLQLADYWSLPQPMLMLHECPEKQHFGQWLFHCNEFLDLDEPMGASRVNVVISNADTLRGLGSERIAQGVIAQIIEQTKSRAPMPKVAAYELITEKRATFAAVPGLSRPTNSTPWNGIYVAGDWTDTGYPAVLEGAVRSGKSAVTRLLSDTGF